MAITQITNNVILDGTILPAKLNVTSTLRTFLGSATSANLAAAVIGTTGSGNLVFATSPTFVTPTLGAATGTTLFLGTGTLNSTAILELSSTTRGFLPPRTTSTQRNAISGATVPSGLTVFNSTDNALSVYTTVLSSWDNIFTARAASFTSDTLRNACSNDTGTGNLVFSDGPTLTAVNITGVTSVTNNGVTRTGQVLVENSSWRTVLSSDATTSGGAALYPSGFEIPIVGSKINRLYCLFKVTGTAGSTHNGQLVGTFNLSAADSSMLYKRPGFETQDFVLQAVPYNSFATFNSTGTSTQTVEYTGIIKPSTSGLLRVYVQNSTNTSTSTVTLLKGAYMENTILD